jgi:hypothetical protein
VHSTGKHSIGTRRTDATNAVFDEQSEVAGLREQVQRQQCSNVELTAKAVLGAEHHAAERKKLRKESEALRAAVQAEKQSVQDASARLDKIQQCAADTQLQHQVRVCNVSPGTRRHANNSPVCRHWRRTCARGWNCSRPRRRRSSGRRSGSAGARSSLRPSWSGCIPRTSGSRRSCTAATRPPRPGPRSSSASGNDRRSTEPRLVLGDVIALRLKPRQPAKRHLGSRTFSTRWHLPPPSSSASAGPTSPCIRPPLHASAHRERLLAMCVQPAV